MIKNLKSFISNQAEVLFLTCLGLAASLDVWRILSVYKTSWGLNSMRVTNSIFYFLQGPLTESSTTLYVLAAVFAASILLLILTPLKRTFFALNFAAYFLFISFYLFHITYEDHRAAVITLMYSLCAIPIFMQQKKWSENIWKALFFGIVLFYFAAGVEKILKSGFAWLNGTTLQILIFHEGQSYREVLSPLLKDVQLAKKAQLAALLVELLAPLALFKRIRSLWLVIIIGFHANLELFFNFKYYYVGGLTFVVTMIAISKELAFFKYPHPKSEPNPLEL